MAKTKTFVAIHMRDLGKKSHQSFVRYDDDWAYASVASDYLDQAWGDVLNHPTADWKYLLLPAVWSKWCYFSYGFNCMNKSRIVPEVKLLALLKIITYGMSFTPFSDYFQMGGKTVMEAV